jgi:hypothetical protein
MSSLLPTLTLSYLTVPQSQMLALSNCMVIGDRRKYLAMVVTLKTEMDVETGASTDKLAADSLFVGKQVQTVPVAISLACH